MREWKECTLNDLLQSKTASLQTGPFGTMLSASEYSLEGTPIIAVQDIGDNQLVHKKLVFVRNDVVERLSRYRVKENDIIFGRKGATDRRALIKLNEEGWLQGSDCIRLRLDASNSSKFISYQLGCLKNWMIQYSTGATMPSLNQEILKLIPLKLPPLPEQEAIASVLSSLDDKIDLLHRQNATLEAMAETLFRQLFVEEAKEEWEDVKLADVITVKGGTTPSTKESLYWDGNINWTTPRDLSNHVSVFLFDTERKITEKGLAQIGSGLLPIGTVLLSSRAPIGYLAITQVPVAINQGYIAILCDKLVSNYFIYLWCKLNLDTIQSSGNGSVFQEISKSVFKELKITIPTKDVLQDFDTTIEPIFQKIKTNQTQIRTLTTLRDTLLPKLMSGEVRVTS